MLWPLLLELAEKTKLSDVHIHSDHGVAYREYGEMVQLDHQVEEAHVHSFLKEVMDKEDYEEFQKLMYIAGLQGMNEDEQMYFVYSVRA